MIQLKDGIREMTNPTNVTFY